MRGEAQPVKIHGSGSDAFLHFDCGAWKKLGTQWMECELCAGHEGDHDYTKDTGRIIGDSPQA